MRFSKAIFLLFTLSSIQQPSFASSPHDYTDAQPLPMLWLNSFENKTTDFRLHLENSSVKEYIYSGELGGIVSSEKGSVYSYEIGYRYGANQHIGVQFGQTGLPLLNIALSLNYQYDFNLTEKSKLLLIAMYGGFIYPGIRCQYKPLMPISTTRLITF